LAGDGREQVGGNQKATRVEILHKKGAVCIMANERAMTAESVNHVLYLARMRRLSGRLTIAQQSGGRIQEGEMYLRAGQPIFVRCESMVGPEALLTLLSWRNVQYTFQLEEPAMTPFGPPAGNASDTTPFPVRPESGGERIGGRDASRASSPEPDFEWLRPQKRDVGRVVLSLPLTRLQRHIFFLVDGHRTLSHLSRCTGKSIHEIKLVLRELQTQGLVTI
jgi:Domain of unknown function (DUF4388)